MNDPRESQLASLVVELAKMREGHAEAKKIMKESCDEIEEQIQRLAAEIESGQGVLGLEVAP